MLPHPKPRIRRSFSIVHQPIIAQTQPLQSPPPFNIRIKIKITENQFMNQTINNITPLAYLAADGEKRLAGGVHEDDLALISRNIIVHPKNQIPLPVEHREATAVEQQRLLPYCQNRRVSSADAQLHSLRSGTRCSGIGIHLCHRHSPNPMWGSPKFTSWKKVVAVRLNKRKATFINHSEKGWGQEGTRASVVIESSTDVWWDGKKEVRTGWGYQVLILIIPSTAWIS